MIKIIFSYSVLEAISVIPNSCYLLRLPGNVCHPNPCKNSGTCVPTDSSYDCECMLGWTGPHCESG